MATNLPLYSLNPAAVSARTSQVNASAFTGGMNRGSNSGNLGANTGAKNPKPQDFSRIQATAPQKTQHIGGSGLGAGTTTNFDLNVVNGADVNNEVAFVRAVANVAVNAVINTTTGARNRTGVAMVSGDWAWGEIPVA